MVKGLEEPLQLVPAAGHKSEASVREHESHPRNADDLSEILGRQRIPIENDIFPGDIFSYKMRHCVLKKIFFLPYCVQTWQFSLKYNPDQGYY